MKRTLASLLCLCGCVGVGYSKEFLPVELRVHALSADVFRLQVNVTSDLGASSKEGAVDATFGSLVRLEVGNDTTVSVEVLAFDRSGALLQEGRIASARSPVEGPAVWRVTLVPAGTDPVVCDDLDNDGNGEVDEEGCAE